MIARLPVLVDRIEQLTPLVRRFTLVPKPGVELPRFSAGSHVMVHMPGPPRVCRNPYSLISNPASTDSYQIAVRRQEASRGGSVYMHERVNPGDLLEISPPVNLFPLDRLARKHLMIAGGIGVTPFMAYVHELRSLRVPFELHYAFRSRKHGAFVRELEGLEGGWVRIYDSSAGERIDASVLLREQPLGTHVYVCGPSSMIDSALHIAAELGWPETHVHSERFTAPAAGRPFVVRLRRSHRVIEVGPDQSILEALEAAGLAVPHLCRAGVCGRCETRLLEGVAEHRDHFLSGDDKVSQRKIMPCVSRARSEHLVLEL